MKNNIEVVYAGGTISSLATKNGRVGGHVVDLVGLLRKRFPTMDNGYRVGSPTVAYTGLSENMDRGYLVEIKDHVVKALAKNPSGVIVTHGTDSMEQTAQYLQRELQPKGRVIITGANEDVSHPKTDAWDNLRFAFESTRRGNGGVYVAFHDKLIPADEVVKEPFNGSEMNYVSRLDPVYQRKIREREYQEEELIKQMQLRRGNHVGLYTVNVIREDHAEFEERMGGLRTALLLLYHSGTANTDRVSVAEMVRKHRMQSGIVFYATTENGEPVDLHSYETSVKLREAGVIPLYDMPTEVAFAKLQESSSIEHMLTSRRGEITQQRIIVEDIQELRRLYEKN